ncbi:hypothetical protein [Acinetobacter baumannii]|uniref:hypothetical protein n=1 Tax=Acinetobacter baumannii TaxID=470 RepID=UPI003B42F98A
MSLLPPRRVDLRGECAGASPHRRPVFDGLGKTRRPRRRVNHQWIASFGPIRILIDPVSVSGNIVRSNNGRPANNWKMLCNWIWICAAST